MEEKKNVSKNCLSPEVANLSSWVLLLVLLLGVICIFLPWGLLGAGAYLSMWDFTDVKAISAMIVFILGCAITLVALLKILMKKQC